MPGNIDLFKKHLSDTFIETGSYLGNGIKQAITAGFEKIISIEISEKYFNLCKNKFENNNKVILIKGDSSNKLKEAISLSKGYITFWLDGHFSGGDTGKGELEVPLLAELNQIKKSNCNIKSIIIDDIWQAEEAGILKSDIEKIVLSTNSKFKFNYTTVKNYIQTLEIFT